MWFSKEICVSTGSFNYRAHAQDGQSVALGSGRNFSPGQIGTSWGVLPSSAALSMTTVHSSFRPFWLGCCLLLMPHEDSLSCPALGRKLSRIPGWAPRVAWGLLLVLHSTGHSPLSGLLWAPAAPFLPAALTPPKHHSCPGSLWLSCSLQVWSGAELCSSLGSISYGVLASIQSCLFLFSCLQHKHRTDTEEHISLLLATRAHCGSGCEHQL